MTDTTTETTGVRAPKYDLTTCPIYLNSPQLSVAAQGEALSDYIRRLSGAPLWSSNKPVPRVGEIVRIGGGFGLCSVAGYFVEHGWLGLRVEPLEPPEWWVRQRAEDKGPPELRGMACVFGVELLKLSLEDYRASAEWLDTAARNVGCFSSFWDLLNTHPGYRPTIHPDINAEHRVLRRAYDLAQWRRGDDRRVFPHDPVDGSGR